MKRWLLVIVLALLGGPALAQDRVSYLDRTLKPPKNEVDLDGVIEEEGPLGLRIKAKGASKLIAPGDITQITYKVGDVNPADFRKPFVVERRALAATREKDRVEGLEKALEEFRELEKKVRGNAAAKRYVNFKIAMTVVALARDNPAKAEDAVKALAEYKAAYPGGWQIVTALKTLATLQEEAGKTDDARKTYEELGEVPDVPKEVKMESDLLVSRLLLRASKYSEAEKKLKSVATALPKDDPQQAFLQAYLADCQIAQNNLGTANQTLQAAIAASPDPELRALAHNLLGDWHRKKGEEADAFWHYLRVDTLYNEEPEEHAKALFHLMTLYVKVERDPQRAAEAGRKLREDKRLAGTVHQKMAGPAPGDKPASP